MTTTKYTFGDYSVSLALEEDSPLGRLDDLLAEPADPSASITTKGK